MRVLDSLNTISHVVDQFLLIALSNNVLYKAVLLIRQNTGSIELAGT